MHEMIMVSIFDLSKAQKDAQRRIFDSNWWCLVLLNLARKDPELSKNLDTDIIKANKSSADEAEDPSMG